VNESASDESQGEIARLRHEVSALTEQLRQSEASRSSLEAIQTLRKRVEIAMLGHDSDSDSEPLERDIALRQDEAHLLAPEAASAVRPYLWNDAQDTSLATVDARFATVCHVFHQEWFGMRAAAGALPGNKLAISADRFLSRKEIAQIARILQASLIDRIVVHGFSEAMEAFVRAIRVHGFDHLYLIWHGAPAMWVFEAERKLAQRAIGLARSGVVRRMQGMRRGIDTVIGKRAFAPQLLNVAPSVPLDGMPVTPRRKQAVVFSPSWNLLHKNLATNLLGAEINPRVGEFWTLAPDLTFDRAISRKVRVLGKMTGAEMLQTMRKADVIANVSIVDCHPMVDQEALAVGVPCLRGPLFLDALEDHPYVRLTEVVNPLSVDDVSRALDRVLDVPQSDIQALIADYAKGIRATSLARYLEFLELA
jgi:hypothetical protein